MINIARKKFIEDILKLINEAGLPAFVMADVLRSCVGQLDALSQKQLEAELKAEETEDNG